MEEAAQNCLPCVHSRFACSSVIPERVLTIEQSFPSVLIVESIVVRQKTPLMLSIRHVALFARDGVSAFATLKSEQGSPRAGNPNS
jgi:hypothetical protein